MLQQRHSLPVLLLLATSITNVAVVHSQPPKQQALQPLGDVLHLVLDKDKNQKVTMAEVNAEMTKLEALFKNGDGDEAAEYRRMLNGVKLAAPTMHQLLDSNGDEGLTKIELNYATKFEKSLKKGGGMRELIRDVFGMLDADGDDQLSAQELLDGSRSDEVISKVTVRFHELFPLRKTAKELEYFVRNTVESIGGNTLDEESVAQGMKWIDDDGDGLIQRKEVGKYYNIAGKKFFEISKTIKQMGPMLAMFGGMDMNGGGMGGGGFKMDL